MRPCVRVYMCVYIYIYNKKSLNDKNNHYCISKNYNNNNNNNHNNNYNNTNNNHNNHNNNNDNNNNSNNDDNNAAFISVTKKLERRNKK